MIEAVLFDFDGTLINTNDLVFESYRYAFREVLHREIDMDEILSLYGRPLKLSLGVYGENQDKLYDTYRSFNASNHSDMVKRFEGVQEGVISLKNMGYKLAIVTSKRMPMLLEGLEFLELTDYFDVLITPDQTEKHKPDPQPVLLACEKLGVKPQNSIMVGDSIFDIQAGINAGTKVCAVKYSTTEHEALEKLGLDYFVDSIKQLAEILQG